MDAKRDWGFAGDFVKGMHSMLQMDEPDTYVLATGTTTSVRGFAKLAFQAVDMDLDFEGSDDSEVGIDRSTGRVVIRVDPVFYRPTEVEQLTGDASKARKELGWIPEMSLEQLAKTMVEADIHRLSG